MVNSRKKQIVEALFNKDQDKLKELKVTNEEVESLLRDIDKKIEKKNLEILNYVDNVEKEINYNFPQDYKKYLLGVNSLKLENNLFVLANGIEKMVRYLYSMDPNSKTYILKFQKFDSKLNRELVPFGELEFGDMLCFSRSSNNIVVYDHENDTTVLVASNWNDFFDSLYKDE